MPTATKLILRQIEDARADLADYPPTGMDWPSRVRATATTLVSWLEESALGLKSYVEDVLNAPLLLRQMWSTIRPEVTSSKEQIEAFDRQLSLDDVLRESVTGDVVSKVITKFLTDHFPELQRNGSSDYPDLFLGTCDYSGLSNFQRKRTENDQVFGACLKGKDRRPVRVPDGLEIKTCRRQIRVDCHYPHTGLHLALVFDEACRFFTITDLRIAFLRSSDYRESNRNTNASTVKYSFNGSRFISLLP